MTIEECRLFDNATLHLVEYVEGYHKALDEFASGRRDLKNPFQPGTGQHEGFLEAARQLIWG